MSDNSHRRLARRSQSLLVYGDFKGQSPLPSGVSSKFSRERISADSDFTDYPRAYFCLLDTVVHPNGHVSHDRLRQLLDTPLIHIRRVIHALVLAGPHDDVESS